jgi:serine/threonine protein kinase
MLYVAYPLFYLFQVMHRDPMPIFHRDIRWPNVLKSADDPTKWFLIDWDDAATPPTIAAKHLDSHCHAPAVFRDNHGPEVDVWAVGRLIVECSKGLLGFPSDLLQLGKDMQSGEVNVSQAFERVQTLMTVTKEECPILL